MTAICLSLLKHYLGAGGNTVTGIPRRLKSFPAREGCKGGTYGNNCGLTLIKFTVKVLTFKSKLVSCNAAYCIFYNREM